VGEITAGHAGNISGTSNDLTLSAYTVGGRYRPRLGHSAWQPFGQVLVGLAHAGGSLVQGSASTVSNAGAVFASSLGGGLDLRVSRRVSFRLAEADYLITTFDNGGNNHQNNLRAGAGIVLRFGSR
jgi:peptidoglycan-associated lipoprotein